MDGGHTQPLDHQDHSDHDLQGYDIDRYAATGTLPHQQDRQSRNEETNH